MQSQAPRLQAFSLVELSVVLVVIGLLVGGIITGQSMLRSSELQTVLADFGKYQAAATDFKKQYLALPGDMADATQFWGESSQCGGGSPNGVCNGDGDGLLASGGAGNQASEEYQFWRQLALSGRIAGSYNGFSGPNDTHQTQPGINTPKGTIGNTGWEARGVDGVTESVDLFFTADYKNTLRIGAVTAAGNPTYGMATGGFLTSEEAWAIDSKVDDGRPSSGKVMAPWVNCTNAADNTDDNAVYGHNSSASGKTCSLIFLTGL